MAIKLNGQNTNVIRYTGKDIANNDVSNADVKQVRVNGQNRWAKPYTLTLSVGTGTTISAIVRTSSNEPTANIGALAIASTVQVYYDDIIEITSSMLEGYKYFVYTTSNLEYVSTSGLTKRYRVKGNCSFSTSATRITWTLEITYPDKSVFSNYYKVSSSYPGYNGEITKHYDLDYAETFVISVNQYFSIDYTVIMPGYSMPEACNWFGQPTLVFNYASNANKRYKLTLSFTSVIFADGRNSGISPYKPCSRSSGTISLTSQKLQSRLLRGDTKSFAIATTDTSIAGSITSVALSEYDGHYSGGNIKFALSTTNSNAKYALVFYLGQYVNAELIN